MRRVCLALMLLLCFAAPAGARELARITQKASILQALDRPGIAPALPQCNDVWTTNLRAVGLWALAVDTRGSGPCADEQPGDAAYLRHVKGRWRVVDEGNELTCRDGGLGSVPVEVQADLLGCPR